jgi:VWFA-related protein
MFRFPGFPVIAASAALAAVASFVVVSARGQEPIKVSVTDVIVPVSVTDDKGRFISNLTKEDFHIFDEGREQKISYFSHDQSLPIVIGFLLDQSNGMKIQWKKYQEATEELMLQLLPDHVWQRGGTGR